MRDETEEEEDDHGQVFLLSNEGGEAQPLTEHETPVSNVQWTPDGEFIYFLANDPLSEEEEKRKKIKDDVYAFDEDYKQRHLWKISVADKEETKLTEGDFSILGYELSRDGTLIAHHRAPTPLYDDSDEGEVYVMAADGRGVKRLTDNKLPSEAPSSLPTIRPFSSPVAPVNLGTPTTTTRSSSFLRREDSIVCFRKRRRTTQWVAHGPRTASRYTSVPKPR